MRMLNENKTKLEEEGDNLGEVTEEELEYEMKEGMKWGEIISSLYPREKREREND